MDTALRTEITALPGSQRATLDLPASAAAQLLSLSAHQQRSLRVLQGRLWLTQDGLAEDAVLSAGEHIRLCGPGNFRLGAFGPGPVRLLCD
jgi:hypothetical protein